MRMLPLSSVIVVLLISSAVASAAESPEPYGPLPTPRQMAWQDLEVYGFIHFGINTFTNKEWGYGDESEKLFNPTVFDAEQIVLAAKAGGLRGLVITCKHHDGFCLWPSKYTEHSVKNSPWEGGRGDMVKEFADACRKHGLKFGVYLSPWDRNHKDYGKPRYIEYYRNQLRELMTGYGPIFEVWFDGANGGDGYYGGARTMRRIDNRTYYDWENTRKIVRRLQPGACMFSDGGPDCRWIGNERGYAGETCWTTINIKNKWPGNADAGQLNSGERTGGSLAWIPGEVDVSIRPGWFYHANEDDKVKSVDHLTKIYYESVGCGANLILNLPPDRRGLIHENDVKALKAWGTIIRDTFADDLALGAKAAAGNARGNDPRFAAGNVVDGRRETYWATDDTVKTSDLTLEFATPVTFDVVRVREYLPLGQRIDTIAVDIRQDGKWVEIAKATSIGNQRLLKLDKPVASQKVRLRVTKAAACPAISEFALFLSPQS